MTEENKSKDNETELIVNEEKQIESPVKAEEGSKDEVKNETKAEASTGWDAPEEPKASGWDAPAAEAKASGWDAPEAEATTDGGWGASTSASAWDAPAPSVDTNSTPARGNNEYKSRDSGRSYGSRDNNEGLGRDEYPRKRFDNDRSGSYGQDKRFRPDREEGDRRGGYPPRDRDYPPRGRDEVDRYGGDSRGGYSSRDRDFPPRDRDYPPRDRDYPPRDRDYPSRDRDYPPRERDHSPRDRDYPPRDRDYPPRDRDYPPRDRDYPPRGRDEGDRYGGDRRVRDEGYPPRGRDLVMALEILDMKDPPAEEDTTGIPLLPTIQWLKMVKNLTSQDQRKLFPKMYPHLKHWDYSD